MDAKQPNALSLPASEGSWPATATAIIIGASGALGSAFAKRLVTDEAYESKYAQVLSLSRLSNTPSTHSQTIDYAEESTIAQSAAWVAKQCEYSPIRLFIVATGYLHSLLGDGASHGACHGSSDGAGPERSFQQLDAAYLQHVMLVNAIGPALVLKHFAPLLPKTGEVRLVFISAKVGSIGDNALGGWYGYRASKAALNQIVKTASIELARRNKETLCIALHPGTVATKLSEPFSKSGLNVRSPEVAAAEILHVIHSLHSSKNGGFYDYKGLNIPW
jgi:NAD(P)-dependent dehydrogenase (short-subunit alcohol dehydrogenase family)